MATWLKYAGLSRQQFSNPVSIAWKQQPSKIVLHSTEGNSYPSARTYRYGKSAPHFTIDVRARTCRQHYPLTEGGWALQAPPGISTNSMGAIQIEIIGTCARNPRIQSVLTFDDDDLMYLGGLLQVISDATRIPLSVQTEFLQYPSSYGNSRTRMSRAVWYAYRGVLGHQHVPGNSHGDPGDFPIARLMQLVYSSNDPTPAPEPVVVSIPDVEEDMESLIILWYRDYLGREPSRAELDIQLRVYVSNDFNPVPVKQGIEFSLEANTRRVQGLYDKYLDRVAKQNEVNHWLAVGKGDFALIERHIASSEEAALVAAARK